MTLPRARAAKKTAKTSAPPAPRTTRARPLPRAKRPARARGVTIDDVRAMALALPDTEERPSYGTPGFRAKDKLFARDREDGTLAVRVDMEVRDALLASNPDVFLITPHYAGYPWIQVRLATVERAFLGELLAEARRTVLSERVPRKRV